MKVKLLILLFFLLVNEGKSQERFFEFLPGWRNLKVIEKENNYLSIGYTSDGIGLNHYQFGSISFSGEILDEWEFDIDTAQFLQSRYTNDLNVLVNNGVYITGAIKGNISDRAYGTFFKFNCSLTDTLWSRSFNNLPGNGSAIRTHLALSPNKFILGGFCKTSIFRCIHQ